MENKNLINENNQRYKAYSAKEIVEKNPVTGDIIGHSILMPRETLVLCGKEYSGKSDFLLHWMMHMAAGTPFINHMTVTRPMKILFICKEASYTYFTGKIKSFDKNILSLAKQDIAFFVAPEIQLTDQERFIQTANNYFPEDEIDIIVIDNAINENPLVHEKGNKAVFSSIEYDIEILREKINPEAGVILTYNYDYEKNNKYDPVERPFCFYKNIIMHKRNSCKFHHESTLEVEFHGTLINIARSYNGWSETEGVEDVILR